MPAPDKWSPVEIIAHLDTLTTSTTAPYDPRRPDFIDVECGFTIGTRAAATGFTGDWG